MGMSYAAATAAVTGPGERFETATVDILGVPTTVFRHAPPSLHEIFAGAREHGDETFLVYEDERWSFADVMRQVDAFGALLVDRYGVTKGDRVAIGMRNYPEWIVAFAAITSIGAISVSLNAWWTDDELAWALHDCGASVLVADRERVERVLAADDPPTARIVGVRLGDHTYQGVDRWDDVLPLGELLPAVTVEPDDDATILYTSGTTGRPKGAVSTHRAVVHALMGYSCRAAIDRLRTADPLDGPGAPDAVRARPVFILIVPLFHVTGAVPVMLGCFASGLKLVIMYRWDTERALELIERERVTTFVGVPTQSWDMLQSPRFGDFDTSSLVSVGGGGAPAPPELVRKVATSFAKANPSIGYGMTETNAYGPQNGGADYLAHPTSTGRATPILEIDVRDELGRPVPSGTRGEIWFKGPNLIRGYWNRPSETAETIVDGWLRTGDIGRIDDEGFVYVEDRAKDVVIRGGENVYSAEVEAAVYEHPAVHEAAVFGVPHERLGEEVAAVVVPRPGASVTADELRAHVAERLASFKVPTTIAVWADPLPRNPAGKVLKRELRDLVVGAAADVGS
jgi:long-chain acyl-CoA synthetase